MAKEMRNKGTRMNMEIYEEQWKKKNREMEEKKWVEKKDEEGGAGELQKKWRERRMGRRKEVDKILLIHHITFLISHFFIYNSS